MTIIDKREIAVPDANRQVGNDIISRRGFPVGPHRHHRMIARMVVRIANERVQAHAPEQFGRIRLRLR